MANSLTNPGQAAMLYGTATPNGGFANTAAFLRLFLSSSVPNKVPGSATWNEVPTANGYAAIAISRTNWSLSLDVGDNDEQLLLATQMWTATGPINNIEGAYITDGSGNVLAWWDRGSPVNLLSGDTLTVAGAYIELQ
jgi:hypothetical protein